MIDTQKIFSFESIDTNDSPEKFSAKWSVSPDLPYFQGHFPDNPILPAIALLDLSKELLQLTLNKTIQFKSVGSAKFLEPIKPHDTLSIELSLSQKSLNWAGLFKNQDGLVVCKLSFSI